MSRPVATILAEIAHLFGELARRVEGDDRVSPILPITPKTNRKPRTIVRPEGESDQLAQAQARRMLRERGFTEVKR